MIKAGRVRWMTAGERIIHGENVATRGEVRLLQLWLTRPRRRLPRFATSTLMPFPFVARRGEVTSTACGTSKTFPSVRAPINYPVTMVQEMTMARRSTRGSSRKFRRRTTASFTSSVAQCAPVKMPHC